MNSSNPSRKINNGAIMERAFSYCNESIKTISLQCRRLKTSEPEDAQFLFRKWVDLRFLILSLDRLDRSVKLARKIQPHDPKIDRALSKFDKSIPFLKKFRDTGEHFDAYSMDSGKDPSIDRTQLQVGSWNGSVWEWLGETLDVVDAEKAAIELFISMRDIKNDFFKNNAN